MRSIIAIFLTTILISGCAIQGRFSDSATFDAARALIDQCDDKGGTFVKLHYDNHQIKTIGVAHLEAGEIFAIRLKPKRDSKIDRETVNYETETVTISPKPGSPAWLSANGSYSGTPAPHHDLIICVPPGTPDGKYYYKIHVNEAGTLDPRADVY